VHRTPRAPARLALLAGLLACLARPPGAARAGGEATPGEECDALHGCLIASPSQECRHDFTLEQPGMVRITVNENDAELVARWRLRMGASVPPSCGEFRTATSADCGPLEAGDYQLYVGAVSGAGSAAVHIQRLTGCPSTLLGCDQFANADIVSPVDNDLFRFSLAGEERIRITVRSLGGTLRPDWRVLTAEGLPAPDCGGFRRSLSADCGPLPPGDYQLNVRDELVAGTGPYAVHLQRLDQTYACEDRRIGCDEIVPGEIEPTVDSDLFRFTVGAVEVVRVAVSRLEGSVRPEWRLLTAAGAPASHCGEFTTSRVVECGPLEGGDYQLHMKDDAARFRGRYELSLTFLVQGCPTCGNGILQGAEQCDPPGGCCSRLCRFSARDVVCREAAGPCDVPETCPGTSERCPENALLEAGAACGPEGPCGVPLCTGLTVACGPPAAAAECRECAAAAECEDGDPCTPDECVGGRCVGALPTGFDGLACVLGKLLAPPPCGEEALDRGLARLLRRRVAKANRLLAGARAAGELRRGRLLRRVDRQLGTLPAKIAARARRGRITDGCATTLRGLLDGSRSLVAQLV
jgi:hypothetical protein